MNTKKRKRGSLGLNQIREYYNGPNSVIGNLFNDGDRSFNKRCKTGGRRIEKY